MTETRSSDELNTAQRLIVAEQLAREALAENAELRAEAEASTATMIESAKAKIELLREVRSLRGVVQAVEALRDEMRGAFGASNVSCREIADRLAAALAATREG